MGILRWNKSQGSAADAATWRAELQHPLQVEIRKGMDGGELAVRITADGEVRCGRTVIATDILLIADGVLPLTFEQYAEMQQAIQEARDALATAAYLDRGEKR